MSLKDAVSALRSLKAELEASRSAKAELENAYRGVLEVCLSGARFSTALSCTLSWQQSRVVFLYAPPTWRDPAGKALPHESTLGHWCFLMHNLWFLPVVSEPIIREFQLQ